MTWSIESVREAKLTPEEVFTLYMDPSTWGQWGHNTRSAQADAPLAEGSVVKVQAGYRKTWNVYVRHIQPDRFIETEVRPPLLVVIQRFEVEPIDDGVRITHQIEVSGRAAGFTRRTLRSRYRRMLDDETSKLVQVANERRGRATDKTAPAG